jgi:PAS domain S-box-containing protein
MNAAHGHCRVAGTAPAPLGLMYDPTAPRGTLEEEARRLRRELAESHTTCSTLRAECQRLKLIIDNAPVLLAYLDTEHRYRYVNEAYAVRFGGVASDVVGRTVAAVLGEKLWSEIRAYRDRVLRGEALEYEVDVERARGEHQRMHCILNPARDREGAVVGYVLAITDVTDRKRVAEARDLLAAVVDSSDDAIVSMTLDGRVTSWNAGATQLFGYTANEMLGHTTLDLDSSLEVQSILDIVARGERVRHRETVCFAKDGRRLDISLSAAPMRDHLGRTVGVAQVTRDITEAKKAEAAIRQSQEALRNADRRKDEFLALLAHELRNPLAPLVNAVELLRPVAADPSLRRIREMMDRQLRQLQRLVDDLLDVSRISRGRFELRRAPVELGSAVETAIEGCQSLVATRGHALTIDRPPESLRIEGDFARLAQVFANLISNSAKYTEPGGRIEVALSRSGSEAIVSVRDSGIGIPQESMDIVFDMFSQVQAHKLHAGGGLGIGLALVRSLVEMHGGSVAAHSEGPGRGSTFTVRLPLLQPVESSPATVRPPGTTDFKTQHKQRILIADDNIDAASSLSLLLEMYGHETRTASNGRQAVEMAEAFQPDIIFMDLGMPVLDGLEATKQIRATPWGQWTLIVALTGWGQERDRRATQEAGMDLHLVKPIDPDGVAAVEAQLLVKRAQVSGAEPYGTK